MNAQCQCGRLSVGPPGPTAAVAACRCVDRRRRSGSPLGCSPCYPADQVAIAGEARRFERTTDEGNRFETFFRPECGSTVYAVAGKHPAMVGVAVGALADPDFPPPARSVWERSMRRWATMPGDAQRFPKGRG